MARAAEDVIRLPAGRTACHPRTSTPSSRCSGAMMLSAEAIADVVEILEADDFYRSAHGKIYAALRDLFAHGEPDRRDHGRRGAPPPADPRRGRRGALPPRPRRPGAHAGGRGALREDRVRRRAAAPADRCGRRHHRQLLRGRREDADRIADDAEQRIYDVARREDKDETAIIGDLVNQAMVDLESIQNRESAYTGMPTGFRDLDDLTSGLQEGNLDRSSPRARASGSPRSR